MTIEGDIKHVESYLVKTISKPDLIETLKEWRRESKNQGESALFLDLLELIRSGDLDA